MVCGCLIIWLSQHGPGEAGDSPSRLSSRRHVGARHRAGLKGGRKHDASIITFTTLETVAMKRLPRKPGPRASRPQVRFLRLRTETSFGAAGRTHPPEYNLAYHCTDKTYVSWTQTPHG